MHYMNLPLDRIDLDRLDLHAVGLEPCHRLLDLFAVAFQLERDNPDGRRHRRVADVENDFELPAHFVDERSAAAFAVEG